MKFIATIALLLGSVFALAQTPTPAPASGADIHIDFTQTLKDVSGKPLTISDIVGGTDKTPITLSWVGCSALGAQLESDKAHKYDAVWLWKLENKIYMNKDAVLDVKEASAIIDRIGELPMGATVTGQAKALLDKNSK